MEGKEAPAHDYRPDPHHHAGDAHPAQRCQKDEQREGAPQLAALAYQIPQRPAGLPEGGVDHAVQGLFQVLLVAAAQGKVAAQPLQLGRLLGGGALGLLWGALVVFVVVWALRKFDILLTPETVEQSRLLRFFAEHSPLDWISGL